MRAADFTRAMSGIALLVVPQACGSDDLPRPDGEGVCGDGFVEVPEACEPGRLIQTTCEAATDGERPHGTLDCRSDCTLDTTGCRAATDAGPVPFDSCPGEHIRLTVTERGAVRDGDTRELEDDFAPHCAYGAESGDAVFDIDVQHTGTLRVTLAADTQGYVPVLHVRHRAAANATELCDDAATTTHCFVALVESPTPAGAGPTMDGGSASNGASPEAGPDAAVDASADASAESGTGKSGDASGEAATGAGRDAGADVNSEAATGGARSDAEADAAQDASGDALPPVTDGGRFAYGRATAALAVASGDHVIVVVDGGTAAGGAFHVEFRLEDAECGDGVVNSPLGEECDDGNTADGDGCDRNCKRVVPENDRCSGARLPAMVLGPGASVRFRGTTSGASDDHVSPCSLAKGGRDVTYGFVTSTNVRVDARLTADFDAVLSIFRECRAGDALRGVLSCSDGPVASDSEQVVLDLPSGAYFVLVDGFSSSSYGTFQLDLTIPP